MNLAKPHNVSSSVLETIWPVRKEDLRKFIPMAMLMFCILFTQNILRILKDSIVIPEISAEITSFAKVYCVTPSAILFVFIYAKMLNHLSFDKIFYYLIAFFLAFFLIFAFILYPNVDFYHIRVNKLNKLMMLYPHFKWYISLVGHWSYIAFYVLSELWPNIFYVLLFWQFANEITTTAEAKRYYMLFSLFGNSSLIVVGLLIMNLASSNSFAKAYFTDVDNKILMVQTAILILSISSILSCLIVRYVCKNIMTDPSLYKKAKMERSTHPKLSVSDSFKYILRSKYLWLMLICSASFGLSINLVEAVWKSQVKELYSTVNAYAEFNSLYILWTGVTIIAMTIIGNYIMRNHSWFIAAVIAPIMIMVTGSIFFALVVFDQAALSIFDQATLMTPLALSVAIGAVQNILSKGTKYSIWDTSMAMLYIPLDNELKTKGKAAVDVVSSKIGKSSGGLILAILFTIVPTATFISISPALMVIFIGVCCFWIYAVKMIYIEYQKIV